MLHAFTEGVKSGMHSSSTKVMHFSLCGCTFPASIDDGEQARRGFPRARQCKVIGLFIAGKDMQPFALQAHQ